MATVMIPEPMHWNTTLLSYAAMLSDAAPSKEQAIESSLARLALTFEKTLNPALLQVYVEHLTLVSYQQLRRAFHEAEASLDFFPTPGKLMHLAESTRKQHWQFHCDAAWMWVHDYIREHGVTGRPKKVTVRDENGNSVGVQDVLAPQLHPVVVQTLVLMAGTTKTGLDAIAKMTAENFSFVRKKFDEAYERAAA